MKLLSDYAKRITDPVFDICGDTSLTAGQTLTVLKLATETIDIEIARWEETIERQTEVSDRDPLDATPGPAHRLDAWAWAVVDPNGRQRNRAGDRVDYLVYFDRESAQSGLDDAIDKCEEGDPEPTIVPLVPRDDSIFVTVKEAADSIHASLAEDGISDDRKRYRVDLERRLRAIIPAPREPAGKDRLDAGDQGMIEDLKRLRLEAWNHERDHLCEEWFAHDYAPHPRNKPVEPTAIICGGSAEYVAEMESKVLAEYFAALHNALPRLIALIPAPPPAVPPEPAWRPGLGNSRPVPPAGEKDTGIYWNIKPKLLTHPDDGQLVELFWGWTAGIDESTVADDAPRGFDSLTITRNQAEELRDDLAALIASAPPNEQTETQKRIEAITPSSEQLEAMCITPPAGET